MMTDVQSSVPAMCVQCSTPDGQRPTEICGGGDDVRCTAASSAASAGRLCVGAPVSCSLPQTHSADDLLTRRAAAARTTTRRLSVTSTSADAARLFDSAESAEDSSVTAVGLLDERTPALLQSLSVPSSGSARNSAGGGEMFGFRDGRRRLCQRPLSPAVSDTVLPPPFTAAAATPTSRSRGGSGAGVSASSLQKRRSPWYSVLKYSYKQRCDEFRRQFDVPSDERLLVDYSCAQVDVGRMIYHGRLYVSQHYVCFVSNVIVWNKVTFCVSLRDVVSITKMNVLLFPSGITVTTAGGARRVLSSFASRDRAFATLHSIWRRCVERRELRASQLWRFVHQLYGDQLGLTSDDDDYVVPADAGGGAAVTNGCVGHEHDDGDDEQTPTAGILTAAAATEAEAHESCREDGQVVDMSPQRTVDTSRAIITAASDSELDSSISSDGDDSCVSDGDSGRCDGQLHRGRHVTSLQLPLHVDQAFTLLFTHSDFVDAFHSERRYYDVSVGEWETGGGGVQTRCVTFRLDVNHPLGKTTTVTERQTLSSSSRPGRHYQVDALVDNSGVPMADVFYLNKHYCLTATAGTAATVGGACSTLDIWCAVQFRRSTLFRGFIERTANDGMDEHHAALNRLLRVTVCNSAAITTSSAGGGVSASAVSCVSTPAAAVLTATQMGGGSKHKRVRRRLHSSAAASTSLTTTTTSALAATTAAVGVFSDQDAASDLGSGGGSGGDASAASTCSGGRRWSSTLPLVLSCALLLLNSYMYWRVWQLAEHTAQLLPADRAAGSLDWQHELQREQQRHADEQLLWRRLVADVACVLRHTETVLTLLRQSRVQPPADGVCVDSRREAGATVEAGEFVTDDTEQAASSGQADTITNTETETLKQLHTEAETITH